MIKKNCTGYLHVVSREVNIRILFSGIETTKTGQNLNVTRESL